MDKKDFIPTKENIKNEGKRSIFLVTYAVILIVAFLNMHQTLSLAGRILSILNPFIIGLIIAFIINIIMSHLEKALSFLQKTRFKSIWKKISRGVCLVLSFMIVAAVITALMFFIVPQIAKSISQLSSNMPGYVEFLQRFTNDLLARFNLSNSDVGLSLDWNDIIEKATSFVASISPGVVSFATNFTAAVFNFIMGLIFSIYLLSGKEKLIANLKKVIYAYLPRAGAERIIGIGHEANRIFTSFVTGQFTDAIILGVMYFIVTGLFRMPYGPLISTLMAFCSLIPMFGPIIGTAASAFILLMTDLKTAIIFVVWAIILQQVEGNIIYPRVVGSSVGLPGILVLFSILVGGSLLGPIGMIVAVPSASLLYTIIKKDVNTRVKEKNRDA